MGAGLCCMRQAAPASGLSGARGCGWICFSSLPACVCHREIEKFAGVEDVQAATPPLQSPFDTAEGVLNDGHTPTHARRSQYVSYNRPVPTDAPGEVTGAWWSGGMRVLVTWFGSHGPDILPNPSKPSTSGFDT